MGPEPLGGRCAAEAPGGDWPFYSGTLEGHREQTKEKSITKDNVSDLGVVESNPKQDGRNMVMVIAPHKGAATAQGRRNAKSDAAAAEAAAQEQEQAPSA